MSRQRFAGWLVVATLLTHPAIGQEEALPDAPPAPQASPAAPVEGQAKPPADAPLPEKRPTEGRLIPPEEMAEKVKPVQGPPMPAELAVVPNTAPLPAERPESVAPTETVKVGPQPLQGPPLPAELVGVQPESEKACRVRLGELKVTFKDGDPQSDANGCSMPYPVSVSAFDTVKVDPPVTVNCAVAETTAKFLRDVILPAAKAELDTEVTAIANGSGYVCRPRTSSAKLSEHALGNAIDIMAFVFEDDRRLDVSATTEPKDAAFLDRVRKAACGPFKTVLGPGSDADHANHFHLDLAERRGGATFCQ